ncbi:histidine kinase [Actinoallomurus purpureus]|uniref:histidine kinase n=1 Tax=Actinoallomurus purpureus TaxID=478114 RepID=UPI0020921402|nr:histidine kinase [Actinoallomurus purpureus]MCO6006509.1 histidine kinase [Actinoallomurus purpureus]
MVALIALPIPLHRRWPLGVLLASSALLFVYYSTGYPGFSPAYVLSVQLYFAALAGKWRWATGVTVFYLIAGYVVTLGLKGESVMQTLSDSLPQVTLLAGIILFGEYARSRRELAAERLRQAEESRERETARRVVEERLRIARELHDTVAHSMVTITVQAGSALHLLGDGDDGSPRGGGRPEGSRCPPACRPGSSAPRPSSPSVSASPHRPTTTSPEARPSPPRPRI